MKGQVALIVLLVSAVVMTLGLSISRKTVVETQVDTGEEELRKAFNAAESGVDYYLGTQKTTYTDAEGNTATVAATNFGVGTSVSSEGLVGRGESAIVWLVDHQANGALGSTYYPAGNVSICKSWGSATNLAVAYFYLDAGTYKLKRTLYTGVADGGCNTFAVGSNPLMLAVTPLGGEARVVVTGSSSFPAQGDEVSATGTTGSGVTRKVTVRNGYLPPPILLEAVTANGQVNSCGDFECL